MSELCKAFHVHLELLATRNWSVSFIRVLQQQAEHTLNLTVHFRTAFIPSV